MTGSGPTPVPARPSVAALTSLDADAWAALLVATRTAHADVDADAVPGPVADLLGGPTSRFVAGSRRRALARAFAGDADAWARVAATLTAAATAPPAALAALLADVPDAADAVPSPVPSDDRSAELRSKLRAVKDEREALRRRADGADARAARADAEVTRLRDELRARDEVVAELRAELAAAADERDRAVARAARRADGEVARLRAEVAGLRRAEEERRHASRRREAEREAAARAATRQRAAERAAAKEAGTIKLVPGRPSQLPRGIRPETTQAADLLLHRGRLVLVDGYNVTLQHQGGLELELQRAWLLRLSATLVATRGIEPVVVFDGARSGGGRHGTGGRGVEVRFTGPGTTADDEIVLAVEGTDRPVVVVTDDRELRARVAVGGADLVATRAFLGVAS